MSVSERVNVTLSGEEEEEEEEEAGCSLVKFQSRSLSPSTSFQSSKHVLPSLPASLPAHRGTM